MRRATRLPGGAGGGGQAARRPGRSLTRLAARLAGGLLALAAGSALAQAPGVLSRTVAATPERALAVAESVLRSRDWEVDETDRAVGWLLTRSRGVDFKDFGVYGKGLRHRLRVTVKAAGEGRASVTVEREVYTEERILWMTERKPVPAPDQTVETALLDAIERSL